MTCSAMIDNKMRASVYYSMFLCIRICGTFDKYRLLGFLELYARNIFFISQRKEFDMNRLFQVGFFCNYYFRRRIDHLFSKCGNNVG